MLLISIDGTRRYDAGENRAEGAVIHPLSLTSILDDEEFVGRSNERDNGMSVI